MVAIETPPFHARVVPPPTAFLVHGGLRIDPKAQVIDVHDKVIPRLYAAGRTTGGGLGDIYPGSGAAICEVFVFGRIAGENAAAEAPWA